MGQSALHTSVTLLTFQPTFRNAPCFAVSSMLRHSRLDLLPSPHSRQARSMPYRYRSLQLPCLSKHHPLPHPLHVRQTRTSIHPLSLTTLCCALKVIVFEKGWLQEGSIYWQRNQLLRDGPSQLSLSGVLRNMTPMQSINQISIALISPVKPGSESVFNSKTDETVPLHQWADGCVSV